MSFKTRCVWLAGAALVLAGLCLTSRADDDSESPRVLHAEIFQDRLLQQRVWQEGWEKPEEAAARALSGGALVRAYFDESVEWDGSTLRLNGKTLDELREELIAPWHRRVKLGGTGVVKFEARLHDANFVARGATVAIGRSGDAGRFSHRVAARPPLASLAYAALGDKPDQLVVYVTRVDGAVTELARARVNGLDVSAVGGEGIQWYGDAGRITLQLPRPPAHGAFQFVELSLVTESGRGVNLAGDFRVLDRPFSVGMYFGGPEDLAKLHFNTKLDYHPKVTQANLDRYHEKGVALIGRFMNPVNRDEASQRLVTEHPAVYALYGFDEPDVKDYKLENVPIGKRVGMSGMEVEAQLEEYRQLQPGHVTYMVIDHTFKPANWYTYAAMADITAVDPYPFVKTHTIRDGNNFKEAIGDVVQIARRAAEPRPLHATLGLHHFKEGRMPDARELRSQVYWALAEGSKGINYFSYTFEMGKGLHAYPELHGEVAALNTLCHHLGAWLLRSQPAAGVLRVGDGVDARVLFGADDALLLFVMARNAADSLEESQVALLPPPGGVGRVEVIDGEANLVHDADDSSLRLTISTTRPGAIIRIESAAVGDATP